MTPPLGALFVTRPHDLAFMLGEWFQPPMANRVIQSQFQMALELVLWTADKDTFTRLMAACSEVQDEPEPGPEQDPIIAIGGAGAMAAGSSSQLLPGQGGVQGISLGPSARGLGASHGSHPVDATVAAASKYAVDTPTNFLRRNGGLASDSGRKVAEGNERDDLEAFKRLVPGGAKSLHNVMADDDEDDDMTPRSDAGSLTSDGSDGSDGSESGRGVGVGVGAGARAASATSTRASVDDRDGAGTPHGADEGAGRGRGNKVGVDGGGLSGSGVVVVKGYKAITADGDELQLFQSFNTGRGSPSLNPLPVVVTDAAPRQD